MPHKLHDARNRHPADASFRVTQYERPKAVNVATFAAPRLYGICSRYRFGVDRRRHIDDHGERFEARFRFAEDDPARCTLGP